MARTRDRYQEIKKRIEEEKKETSEVEYTYSIYDVIKVEVNNYAVVEIKHNTELAEASIVEKDIASLARALTKRDEYNAKEHIKRIKKGL